MFNSEDINIYRELAGGVTTSPIITWFCKSMDSLLLLNGNGTDADENQPKSHQVCLG
jgi:hypothetical protein